MFRLPVILILPYFIILLYIFRNLLKIKTFRPSQTAGITVSVVVACRNEQEVIPDLLIALARQDYPPELFEVIIVDDNSTDMTRAAVKSYASYLDLKIIANQGMGKKTALLTGIGIASGELIITTDADCIMGERWVHTIASFYATHKPDMIICPVKLEPMKGFFGKFQELEFLSLQAVTAGTAEAGNGTMCNGANLAFTKSAYYDNVKNIRMDIFTGDDVFLLHSMKKQGSKIMWLESSNAAVETRSASDFTAFLKQRRRWMSKAGAYKDVFSMLIGIVTFVTILIQAALTVVPFFDHEYLPDFLSVFLLKSIPDFLMLQNVAGRYGKSRLLWWFLPSQIIYPFYVLAVTLYTAVSSAFPGSGFHELTPQPHSRQPKEYL